MASADSSFTAHFDEAQTAAARRVILFTVFLGILGFGIILPQLGVYAAQFGASPEIAGVLASSYSAMSFLVSPFLGRLSDRIGRRPVLLVSIFGTAIGYLIFGFAHSLALLFAARIIDGISSGNISTAQAYLSDITPPKDRAKIFGLFGAVFGVGFALGPTIGTALSHLPGIWGGNLGLGVFAAALSFLNWALALKMMPETLSPAVREQNNRADAPKRGFFNLAAFGKALKIPNLGTAIVIGFLATAAFATLQGTYSFFIIKEYVRPAVQKSIKTDPNAAIQSARQLLKNEEATAPTMTAGEGGGPNLAPEQAEVPYPAALGGDFQFDQPAPEGLTWRHIEKLLVRPQAAQMVGIVFTVIGLLSLVIQGGLMRVLPQKFGEGPLIIAGTAIMAIALAIVPLPSTFYGQIGAACLLTLGNGISTPILTALVSQMAPESERGEIIGVYQSTQSLGRIIGPNFGGFLFGTISAGAPFFAGGIVMGLAFLLTFQLRKVRVAHEEIVETAVA